MLATPTDSQTHFFDRHAVTPKGGSDGLWAHGFRNCFLPPGVLFTAPLTVLVRYRSDRYILGLPNGLGQIRTGFHGPALLWDDFDRKTAHVQGTGLAPSAARPSSLFPYANRFDSRPARRNRDT